MVCEYASFHGDDTFSIVRGGIESWLLPRLPAQVAFTLLLVIPPGVLAPGQHELSFRLTTASGAATWAVQASVEVSNTRQPIRGIIPLEATIDAHGDAVIEVDCAGGRGQATIVFHGSPA